MHPTFPNHLTPAEHLGSCNFSLLEFALNRLPKSYRQDSFALFPHDDSKEARESQLKCSPNSFPFSARLLINSVALKMRRKLIMFKFKNTYYSLLQKICSSEASSHVQKCISKLSFIHHHHHHHQAGRPLFRETHVHPNYVFVFFSACFVVSFSPINSASERASSTKSSSFFGAISSIKSSSAKRSSIGSSTISLSASSKASK